MRTVGQTDRQHEANSHLSQLANAPINGQLMLRTIAVQTLFLTEVKPGYETLRYNVWSHLTNRYFITTGYFQVLSEILSLVFMNTLLWGSTALNKKKVCDLVTSLSSLHGEPEWITRREVLKDLRSLSGAFSALQPKADCTLTSR